MRDGERKSSPLVLTFVAFLFFLNDVHKEKENEKRDERKEETISHRRFCRCKWTHRADREPNRQTEKKNGNKNWRLNQFSSPNSSVKLFAARCCIIRKYKRRERDRGDDERETCIHGNINNRERENIKTERYKQPSSIIRSC